MEIPDFNRNTFLPPGIYTLTWTEVCERFGWNLHRKKLLEGLKRGLEDLKACGCLKVYLDGSFISQRDRPKDFDICYEEEGMDFEKLSDEYEELTVFKNKRKLQKSKYGGEFLRANDEACGNLTFKDFFQLIKDPVDPDTINFYHKKGIISINLETL